MESGCASTSSICSYVKYVTCTVREEEEAVCVARALATCGCDVNTVPSAMHLGPAASDLERHLGASGS